MVNYPLEVWRPDKVRESVSGFGKFLVWNRDMSNHARILIKVRVPDLLEIPISHVICEGLDDFGHGQSWTCAVYILQADLLGAMGGDEDPIPPDGVLHPMPQAPFGGIWHDTDFMGDEHDHAAPAAHHAPAADNDAIPMIPTPPLSPESDHHEPPI